MNESNSGLLAAHERDALERNLKTYRWFVVASSIMPWLAVFYLYFVERVSAAEAINLGALYYLAVVLFEVPSGYLSDRFGRKLILVASAIFMAAAYICYLGATNFQWLLVGQIFLAAGIAFASGSDTSLLFDTLKRLGREDEYGDIDARTSAHGLIVLALSCLIGGVLGVVDLRLIYLAALVGAIWLVYLCSRFVEPMTLADAESRSFLSQLRECLAYRKDAVLVWILGVYVFGYALQHVPYEFFQPYVQLLTDQGGSPLLPFDQPSVVAGIVISVSMFGGAIGASISMPVYRKLGLISTLLVGIVAIVVVIACMALVLHPALLLLVMCRNLPMSMVSAPMRAAMAPRVRSHHRATYLSLQSLLGRLAFSIMLGLLAMQSGHSAQLDWQTLSWILTLSMGFGIAVVLGLIITSDPARRLLSAEKTESE